MKFKMKLVVKVLLFPQQLMVLRNKNIVVGTKNGNRVIYSLRDPLIIDLLQVAKQIFNNHLVDTISMLDKMNVQDDESVAEK